MKTQFKGRGVRKTDHRNALIQNDVTSRNTLQYPYTYYNTYPLLLIVAEKVIFVCVYRRVIQLNHHTHSPTKSPDTEVDWVRLEE